VLLTVVSFQLIHSYVKRRAKSSNNPEGEAARIGGKFILTLSNIANIANIQLSLCYYSKNYE
jgi:hypothetical protein